MAGVPPSYGRPSQRLSRTVRGRQAAPLAACRTLPSHRNQTAARRLAATNWRDTGTPAVREAGHASLLQCWAVLSHRHAEQRQSAGHHAGRRCSTCALAGADQHRRPSRCPSVALQSPRSAEHAIASEFKLHFSCEPAAASACYATTHEASARRRARGAGRSGVQRRAGASTRAERCLSGCSHIASVHASSRRPSLPRPRTGRVEQLFGLRSEWRRAESRLRWRTTRHLRRSQARMTARQGPSAHGSPACCEAEVEAASCRPSGCWLCCTSRRRFARGLRPGRRRCVAPASQQTFCSSHGRTNKKHNRDRVRGAEMRT